MNKHTPTPQSILSMGRSYHADGAAIYNALLDIGANDIADLFAGVDHPTDMDFQKAFQAIAKAEGKSNG